jgi:hypothetical protein
MGDVRLDVTVPDRATASMIRAAIRAVMPTDGKSGVHLPLPPLPRSGSALAPDHRLRGKVVVDGLSHADAADLVERALREPAEVDYRRTTAAGRTAEFVIWLRSPQPIWELHSVCTSWRDESEATTRSHGVHYEGSKRYRRAARHQLVGHTLVALVVRADDEAEARQRVSGALEAADVGFLAFASVTRRG